MGTNARTCRSLAYIIFACRLSQWFVNTILRHVFPLLSPIFISLFLKLDLDVIAMKIIWQQTGRQVKKGMLEI